MDTLELRDISKWFESTCALRRVDLNVEAGEFLVILGPSGCGKTTTLRCIAGVEEPTTGEIHFGSTCVFSESEGINLAPRDRNVGLVFQNYALYPHMTVFENITFGLKIRRFGRSEIERAAQEAVAFVGLEGLEERRPSELSGGQQQRVALARLIARKPQLLLFDEPFSNLDPKLRTSLRAELKQLHTRLGTTSVFVTHDQQEAMILADRIVVMHAGEILQSASPDRIYHFPNSVTVAGFTGRPKTNFLRGVISRNGAGVCLRSSVDPDLILDLPGEINLASGQEMILHVRPEELDIDTRAHSRRFGVFAAQPQGAETLVHLRYAGNEELLVRTTNAEAGRLEIGTHIGVTVHRGNLFSPETELLVTSFGK